MSIDWANPISVTTTATLTIGKHHVCSGTTADYTVTLPAAAGCAGQLLSIEMAAGLTKLITIDGNASETIAGDLSFMAWAKESYVLYCNGTSWSYVVKNAIPMEGSLYNNTTTSVTAVTDTKVPMDALLLDNTGLMCNITTGTITVKRAGRYHLVLYLFFLQGNNTDTYCQARLFIDGAHAQTGSGFYKAAVQSTVMIEGYFTFTAGQAITAYGFIGAGTGCTIYASPNCKMILKEDCR